MENERPAQRHCKGSCNNMNMILSGEGSDLIFFFNSIAQVIKLVDRVTHECASLFDTKPLHEPMLI